MAHSRQHDIETEAEHSASGLTAGHVLRAASATTFAFAAIGAGDLPTAIDAAKIANGSVSNAEFQYLNGVSGAIQTALDAKMPLSGGTFTGDVLLSGTTKLKIGDAGQYIQESAPTVLSYVSAGRHEFTGDVWINKLKLPTTTSSAGIIEINSERILHTYGTGNLFLGAGAGNFTLTTAASLCNVGIGANVLDALTSGQRNVGVGYNALTSCTSGKYNSGMGYCALEDLTTGERNVALGYQALSNLTEGTHNIGIGHGVMVAITDEDYNTAIGYQAMYRLTGSASTAVGYHAGYTNTNGGSVYLGNDAGYHETAANKLFIDNAARTNEADARVKALIYGVFAAATADQLVRLNSKLEVLEDATFAGDILSPNNAKHYFDDGASQGTEYIVSGADTYFDIYHGAGGGARFYDENNLLLTVSRYSSGAPTQTKLSSPSNLSIYTGGDKVLVFGIGSLLPVVSMFFQASNLGLYWGASNNARMYYDGANLIINPNSVGTGKFLVGASGEDETVAGKFHVNTAFTEYAHSANAGHYDIEAGTSIDLNATVAFSGAAQVVDKVSAYLGTDQTIGTGSWTKVLLDTENFDTGNHFASNRFTAVVAGYYQVSCCTMLLDLGDAKYGITAIRKNGTEWARATSEPSGAAHISVSVSRLIHLAATEYVELYFLHNHGSDRSLRGLNEGTFMTVLGPF